MRKAIILAMAISLVTASPIYAQETWQEKLKRQLGNEDISKAIGSLAGALLGSQVGSGKGKIAAIAVGTFAGYWLGGKLSDKLNQQDKAGIAGATQKAIETGKTTTWQNPKSGMQTRVSVKDAKPGVSNQSNKNKRRALDTIPPLELANTYYTPTTNINVRGGPSTEYEILYSLKKGSNVPVIGRVDDSKWLVIAEGGVANGFVYGPLMDLSDEQLYANQAGNAVRHASAENVQADRFAVTAFNCRDITQEVVVRDGTRDSHTFKACQQSDGSWVEV